MFSRTVERFLIRWSFIRLELVFEFVKIFSWVLLYRFLILMGNIFIFRVSRERRRGLYLFVLVRWV